MHLPRLPEGREVGENLTLGGDDDDDSACVKRDVSAKTGMF